MILFIAILLIALGIISALAAIYCLYCIIGARIFNKKVKNEKISEVHIHLFLILILQSQFLAEYV